MVGSDQLEEVIGEIQDRYMAVQKLERSVRVRLDFTSLPLAEVKAVAHAECSCVLSRRCSSCLWT